MVKKQYSRDCNIEITIIGLGYVGLNLAIELNKHYKNIIGYDLKNVIDDYKNKIFNSNISKDDFNRADIIYTNNLEDISNSDFYIFTVPTPVNKDKIPDLYPLIKALMDVALSFKNRSSKKPPILCFESTIFPGATESICASVFTNSGMERNKDFYIAYSPERINPGDSVHTINNVIKIIASDNNEARDKLAKLYSCFIDYNNGGDIIVTDSIDAAEAAKMLENCQRDVLIALANEYAIALDELNIDKDLVFKLAQTKWNFATCNPGLVGGHCIPVDPYYMIDIIKNKTKTSSQVLEAARKTNEEVPIYLANKICDLITDNIDKKAEEIKIGVLGIAYKPEVDDIRNSKIIDMTTEMAAIKHYSDFIFYDPYVSSVKSIQMYNIEISNINEFRDLDVLIIATAHNEFIKPISKYTKMLNRNKALIIDINGCCINAKNDLKNSTISYWRYFGCK